MPITQTLPLPLDGVSQQPDEIRAPTTAVIVDNMDVTQIRGMTTRPGTKHIATLSGLSLATWGSAKTHFIDRSEKEKYMVLMNGAGGIVVVNLVAGGPYGYTAGQVITPTIQYADGSAYSGTPTYLTAADPQSFRLITVGDHTYICNKEVLVLSNGTLDTSVDAFTYDYTKQSVTAITSPAASTLYKIEGLSPDGSGAQYFKAGTGNQIIETHNKSTGSPSALHTLNWDTTPWVLSFSAGNFYFRQGNYAKQDIGDNVTNPRPSIVNRYVRDVFFFRNRIGFITQSTVVMSQPLIYTSQATNVPLINLYRKTSLAVSADDVIDVSVSHPKAPTLHAAGVYNKALMIFGDTVQFQAFAQGDVLSPSTFGLTPTLEFDCSSTIRPIGLGPKMYFAQPSTAGARIRELYVTRDKVSLDAVDVTAQCPTYVSPNIFQGASSASENILVFATKTYSAAVGTATNVNGNALFLYRPSFDGDGQRTQSAWTRYTLNRAENDAVVGMGFSQATLYLIISRTSGLFLETIDWVTPAAAISGIGNKPYNTGILGSIPIWVSLDRAVTYAVGTGTYSTITGRTTWTSAYTLSGMTPGYQMKGVVIDTPGPTDPQMEGIVAAVTVDSSTQFSVLGDFTAQTFTVGLQVSAQVMMPRIQLLGKGGPNIGGQLRIKTLEFSMRDSGPFQVLPLAANQSPHGAVVGGYGIGSTLIGAAIAYTGRGRVSVNGSAEKTSFLIYNTTPIRVQITGITWEGEWFQRTKRV